MTSQIVVPNLGESVVEATVGRWFKQPGDPVAVGDVLVELQTDKVDVEVGAQASGVLGVIAKQEGEDVAVGEALGTIEPAGAGQPQPAQPQATAEPQPKAEPAAESKPRTPAETAAERDGARATPVARRIADEQGVRVAEVAGSGPGGRVTKEDVRSYVEKQKGGRPEPASTESRPVESRAVPPARVSPGEAHAQPVLSIGRPEREERIRMSRRRRTIARRLVEAQQTAAMLTTFNEVDMSAVMTMRKRRQEAFQKRHNIKLGFMSFFVRAAIGALKAFPRLNAEIQGDEIVLKRYYDIGMAIGADEGLVVPVLRDADRMSFAEIEQAIEGYVQKVRDGSLALDQLMGGTFTITNGGVFGSLLSTPIINPPQVAILGLHKIEERPVAMSGEVVVRPMMYVALTYDHRIVDGREAVQFLVRVKELIEDPETLLLEG
jgi:2-oxoglutarate dehydrogenase E2 component (dihydrolipoamide succinyltransferase)